MKKYVFDDTTIHTLHSLAKKLYDTFRTADYNVAESKNQWSHSFDVDFSVNPWNYYQFQMANYQCNIHKFRNGDFTLVCYGFKPEGLKPYDVYKYNIEFYKNLYGKWRDFDSARMAFADAVSELACVKTQPLF